jgi:hypothetical protein
MKNLALPDSKASSKMMQIYVREKPATRCTDMLDAKHAPVNVAQEGVDGPSRFHSRLRQPV